MGCYQTCFKEKSIDCFNIINNSKSSHHRDNTSSMSLSKLVPFRKESFKIAHVTHLGFRYFSNSCLSTTQNKAIKSIPLSKVRPKFYQVLLENLRQVSSFNHPYILPALEVTEDDEKLYIKTDYALGGDLFEHVLSLPHFSEKEAADIVYNLISTIAFCHRSNISHRDLKPENILVFNNMIMIQDFFTSARLITGSFVPTTAYCLAPEVFKGSESDKSDIWSLGVIIYTLLSGFPPFSGNSEEEIVKKINRGVYTFHGEVWTRVSKEAKQLLRGMLVKDPESRISAEDVLYSTWMLNKEILGETSLGIHRALKQFENIVKSRRTLWVYLVDLWEIEKEIDELRGFLVGLDVTGNETLTVSQIQKGLRNVGTVNGIDDVIKNADSNGIIEYNELLSSITVYKKEKSKQEAKICLEMYNVEDNGFISERELKVFLGEDISEDAWTRLYGDYVQESSIAFETLKNEILNAVN